MKVQVVFFGLVYLEFVGKSLSVGTLLHETHGRKGKSDTQTSIGCYSLSWSNKRTLLLNSNLRVVLVFAYQKNPDVLHMYVIGKPCDIRSTKVTHRETGVTSPIELSGGFISANNKCLFNSFFRSR